MADVLSVLRELRSLELKKEAGSLSPEESARLVELQAALSSRFPPIAEPRSESAPDAPFVDAVLQEEPTESRTGVIAHSPSVFEAEPAASSDVEPSFGTPFKTPPPISPPAAEVPGAEAPEAPTARPGMSNSELQQWGQVFAPVPFVEGGIAVAPAVTEVPAASAAPGAPWPIASPAVLKNIPVAGATGFADSEKTVMEHLPPIPAPPMTSGMSPQPATPALTAAWEVPAPAPSPPSSPPRRPTSAWEMTAVPAPPPAPADLPNNATPMSAVSGWPAPSAPTPMPSAWQQGIPETLPVAPAAATDVTADVTIDDAPAVWETSAPRVPQVAASAPVAPAAAFPNLPTLDMSQDLTSAGGPIPSPLPGLPFAWPKSPPAAPPPAAPIEPSLEESEIVSLDDETLELDEARPAAAAAPAFERPDAIELPSLELDESEDLTNVSNPLPQGAFVPPAAPPPAPRAPPLRPTVASPAVQAPPPEPTWTGHAAGSRPWVGGESRVVIHTLEGVQKRGTLFDVDLSAPALDLALPDGRSELIATSSLKVVFFMVPMGQPVPKPQGAPVTVLLHDGRQLEGLSPDYKVGAPGFFVCPIDQRSRAARIYVYAPAVKEIL